MENCQFTGEYIQLNQFLKKENLASSGGEARAMIEEGLVRVNGSVAHEIRKKLRNGDIVEVSGYGRYQLQEQ